MYLAGISIVLLNIFLYSFYERKKIHYVVIAIAFLGLTMLTSVTGLVTAIISVAILTFVRFICSLNIDRNMLLATAMIAFMIMFLGLFFFYFTTNDLLAVDIANSYMENLYSNSRFSALPFINLSISMLIYIHFLMCWFLRRGIIKDKVVIISLTLTLLTYVVLIGIMYSKEWARENINVYGEYMTGFDRYMIIPAAIIYSLWFWLFVKHLINHLRIARKFT